MLRAISMPLAIAIVSASLSACSTSLDRGIQYCQDNYFGYTQLRCERQVRAQQRR